MDEVFYFFLNPWVGSFQRFLKIVMHCIACCGLFSFLIRCSYSCLYPGTHWRGQLFLFKCAVSQMHKGITPEWSIPTDVFVCCVSPSGVQALVVIEPWVVVAMASDGGQERLAGQSVILPVTHTHTPTHSSPLPSHPLIRWCSCTAWPENGCMGFAKPTPFHAQQKVPAERKVARHPCPSPSDGTTRTPTSHVTAELCKPMGRQPPSSSAGSALVWLHAPWDRQRCAEHVRGLAHGMLLSQVQEELQAEGLQVWAVFFST